VQNERVLVVNHPLSDERTAYFRGIIEVKNISEIPYIPFPLEENGSIGVIVFDGPQTVVQRRRDRVLIGGERAFKTPPRGEKDHGTRASTRWFPWEVSPRGSMRACGPPSTISRSSGRRRRR